MKKIFVSCCMIALLLLFPVCSSIGFAAGDDDLSNIETSGFLFCSAPEESINHGECRPGFSVRTEYYTGNSEGERERNILCKHVQKQYQWGTCLHLSVFSWCADLCLQHWYYSGDDADQLDDPQFGRRIGLWLCYYRFSLFSRRTAIWV